MLGKVEVASTIRNFRNYCISRNFSSPLLVSHCLCKTGLAQTIFSVEIVMVSATCLATIDVILVRQSSVTNGLSKQVPVSLRRRNL